jgi:AraC-like DNA-binding protein
VKLAYTDASITDIAYACGFNNLSYFIKTFRRQKGISPGKFRQKNRE